LLCLPRGLIALPCCSALLSLSSGCALLSCAFSLTGLTHILPCRRTFTLLNGTLILALNVRTLSRGPYIASGRRIGADGCPRSNDGVALPCDTCCRSGSKLRP
jgi:hypothetical protein